MAQGAGRGTGAQADGWDDSWFFIIGCQRSGTTLMRLVLECHSEIECRDEAISYGLIAGRRSTKRGRPRLGLKVPCLTEQFAAPAIYDVKWIPEIPNGYRNHPLIFMVRDVRDTVASMLELKVFGRRWVEASLGPTIRAKSSREPAFVARYGALIDSFAQHDDPTVARAAFCWRYKTDALPEYQDLRLPVLMVRYEDLVNQPRATLERVCRFLGVGWEPGLLRHARFQHGELDSDGIAMGGTDASRPIDATSTGRWRRTFSPAQVSEILAYAGPLQGDLYGTDT
ncbi:MAG TPA: sulfotransferase [Vicinamibacterales bacterium]|nr:sulfotransferase [Vicinamibacterales bacterium]